MCNVVTLMASQEELAPGHVIVDKLLAQQVRHTIWAASSRQMLLRTRECDNHKDQANISAYQNAESTQSAEQHKLLSVCTASAKTSLRRASLYIHAGSAQHAFLSSVFQVCPYPVFRTSNCWYFCCLNWDWLPNMLPTVSDAIRRYCWRDTVKQAY